MTKHDNKTVREAARKQLLEWIKPGDTIYTILRHRSASGISREISLMFIKIDQGEPRLRFPNYLVSQLLGMPQGKSEGIKISGCGMDMGFDLVYRLGSALWPEGTPTPHGMRNGEPDSAGGYALRHQWI